jgi:hypothetical protein
MQYTMNFPFLPSRLEFLRIGLLIVKHLLREFWFLLLKAEYLFPPSAVGWPAVFEAGSYLGVFHLSKRIQAASGKVE